MIRQSRIALLAAAALFAAAIPFQGLMAREQTLVWTQRSSGGLTALAYGSIDPAENPLFVLSCFNGMSIAVLDVHKDIAGTKPGQPIIIEISSAKAESPVEAEVTRNETTGGTFAEASDIKVKPVLQVLRDPGPLTVKMGATSATLSDQGRAEAVSKFSQDCRVE